MPKAKPVQTQVERYEAKELLFKKYDELIGSISERALHDFNTRKAILTANRVKPKTIIIPNVPHSISFWSWYLEKIRANKKGVPEDIELKLSPKPMTPYDFRRPIILAYSGGAESTLINNLWPSIDTFTILNTRVDGGMFTHPIEGALAIIGAGLGYHTTLFGYESDIGEKLDDGEEPVKNKFFEVEYDFCSRWTLYSGGVFMSPTWALNKLQVVKLLAESNIEYSSCLFSKKGWCKACMKCVEIYYLHKMNGLKPPFEITY